MEILNDLTKCNFYYYILSSNKAYLIFKYLQFAGQSPAGQPGQVALTNDFNFIGDALVRRQKIRVENKIIRFLNTDLKQQYIIINKLRKLKSNPNINLDKELIVYSKLDYLLIAQYLVSNGANIHAKDEQALGWAANNGHLEIVQYLVSVGANIHFNNDWALRYAANNGRLNIVQYLVSKGANIHALDDLALRWAAGNGHLAIVQYLVSIGANPNILTFAQKVQFNIN